MSRLGQGTYQLHLVLDAEELKLRVGPSTDTIRQLGDELEARDEGNIILVQQVADMVLGSKSSKLIDTLNMVARVSVADQVR
jgi:hypothetical protein